MRCILSLAISIIPLAVCSTGTAADPMLEKSNLFEAGKDGYVMYRIPGLVVTAKGTILAYCEARKSGNDWARIDILLRRSADGGKTWEAPRKLVEPGDQPKNPVALQRKQGKPGEVTVNNPVAIVDHQTGAVHFLYCIEYARCYYMKSDDDGKTFTAPVEITSTFEKFRPDYDWKVLATGPAHGIQLKNGRLVVPVWLSTGAEGNGHRPSCMAGIFSDDHGKTWNRSQVVAASPTPPNPSETVAVQLHDGRVLFNIRHEGKPNRRAISISPDGAGNWSPVKYDEQLPEPVCMASIIRYSEEPDSKNRILFANPHNADNRQRKNLTIKLSYDECRTWPAARALEPGTSGYSDLAVAPDGTIYCFYERGSSDKNHFNTGYLCLARFNLEWVTEGKDRR